METKFEFTPKQWILVKSKNSGGLWTLMRYSHMNGAYLTTTGGIAYYTQDFDIIPFEGNEHLLGTADDYVEPYEPKDGDFVKLEGVSSKALCIALYRENYDGNIVMYAVTSIQGTDLLIEAIFYAKVICPATEEEKQTLLDALHEKGKDWDAEKKEIVDYMWKPKHGESYFKPKIYKTKFVPARLIWQEEEYDLDVYNKGWAFQTEEGCQPLCDKLNESIKNVK